MGKIQGCGSGNGLFKIEVNLFGLDWVYVSCFAPGEGFITVRSLGFVNTAKVEPPITDGFYVVENPNPTAAEKQPYTDGGALTFVEAVMPPAPDGAKSTKKPAPPTWRPSPL